ncbi:developmental sensor histidine kinase SasS [Plesiocystis pacifica SIR-1]|uniref:histidine kinase n=1 Tax=Plesiocystis pacifica SIR-1 TaxID=391625 RepID=A6G7M9_9BACT|nr:HAMP domain-containing sensor histidine kinase [Plesiocystis pacifica]EDM78107.1 developmental sensor histidine kinase SasS [Plesiocystis pacifica SIR-1]
MSQTALDQSVVDLKAELERLYDQSQDPNAFGRSLLSFLDELGRKVRDEGESTNVAEQIAEQLDRAATATLAAGAMHDLRSLVQVLVAHIDHSRNGVLGMAATSGQAGPAREVLRTLDEARLVAATMVNITRDGVALQRAAGAGAIVDLPDLLKTTLRMHRRVAKGRLVLADIPRVDILAPRGALLRVLANLIKNALDAIPEGPEGRVSISAWVATDDVFVQVADNGPGIPEEMQPKIFDMFFTTKEKGSGVGLPVCRRLVEEWGGTLQVQSRPGSNAQFTTQFTFGVPRG